MARDKDQKVYMPLMIGDWLKGTSGMKAEVRGVYINLLLHQWDHGFIPEDIEEISLIAPEVGKVWDKLKVKFPKVENGKLQNSKLEKVRAFWKKQGKNGKKGGRPPKENPVPNPNINPKENPNTNLHNDLDLDNDLELKLKRAFDEIYLEQQKPKWAQKDFDFEYNSFIEKVRGSPDYYTRHTSSGLRLALQSQLRNARNKINGNTNQKSIRRADATVEQGKAFGEFK